MHSVGNLTAHSNYLTQPLVACLQKMMATRHTRPLATAHLGTRIGAWARLSSQHDAAEFYAFFARAYIPGLAQGLWQSRLQRNGRIHMRDSGNTFKPIALPNPSGVSDILDMLQAWHDQAGIHALVQAPDILAVKLNRFGTSRHGGTKVHTACEALYRTIMMPHFDGPGLSFKYTPCQLLACLLHDGPHARQGHYSTILRAAEGWCLKDDAREATILDQSAAQSLAATRCYVMLYRKLPQ